MNIRLHIAIYFFLAGTAVHAQVPLAGVSVQEVAIVDTLTAVDMVGIIDGQLPINGPDDPRCWRVYVCFSEPFWELQVLYGDNTANWVLSTTTSFFQATLNGGFIAATVNPAFFSFEPESIYDSWYTIGRTYDSSTNFLPGSVDPSLEFEGNGNGFLVNDIVGSSVFGAWSSGATESMPDVDGKVLVAQFTTDGIFNATFNFQFRELNPDSTIVIPSNTVVINGVTVDGTPGAEPDVCPITFLPIELLSFTAKPDNDQVLLNWVTATEINNDYYTIERSVDLANYEEVVRMDGAGTSQLTNYYAALDSEPLHGVSYYRLKQTDFNGDFAFSDPVAVEFKSSEINIYPNPTRDQVSFQGDLAQLEGIRITDARGKLVLDKMLDTDNMSLNLPFVSLEMGMYVVEMIYKNGDRQFEQLIVRK